MAAVASPGTLSSEELTNVLEQVTEKRAKLDELLRKNPGTDQVTREVANAALGISQIAIDGAAKALRSRGPVAKLAVTDPDPGEQVKGKHIRH